MKRLVATIFALTTISGFASEPDVDYLIVDTFYTDGNKIELALESDFDGLDLQKVIMSAKAKTLAQANLIINGITIDKKLINSGAIKEYTFDTSANAITFGYNLDTIEIQTQGAMAIDQFAVQVK